MQNAANLYGRTNAARSQLYGFEVGSSSWSTNRRGDGVTGKEDNRVRKSRKCIDTRYSETCPEIGLLKRPRREGIVTLR